MKARSVLLLGALLAVAAMAQPAQPAAASRHKSFDGIWARSIPPRVARAEGECCTFEGWDAWRTMLQPWALAVMEKRKAGQISGHGVPTNTLECKPDGVPTILDIPYPFQFLQTPNDITIIHEADYQVRQVRLNGVHPDQPKLSWYGDSIGRWEGEELVIDTVGLSVKGQLNWDGIPHSDQLHVVERYKVTAPGELLLTMTLTDPGALVAPWTIVKHFHADTGRKLTEYVCAENNRDAAVPTE